MKVRLLIVVAISLVLVSCAGKDRKVAPSPTPLAAISANVQLNKSWQSSSSASRSEQGKFLTLLPALSSDRIIFASSDGTVSAVGKDKPSLLWSSSLDEDISAGVGEADGVVVVVSESGNVIAFNSETGIQRWEQPINQIIFAQPLVYRGKVILRTIDGDLIGLDSNSGEISGMPYSISRSSSFSDLRSQRVRQSCSCRKCNWPDHSHRFRYGFGNLADFSDI